MKLPTILYVILIGFCLFIPAQAQKRYLFHTYTTRDGLANNTVYCINQDRLGYIWFGTDAGVSRFDGYKFDNHIIPIINDKGSFVQYIEKDKTGNLVIAGIMQGIHVQQSNGLFRQYLMDPNQIGKNTTNTIKACPDGSFLVSQSRYLLKFQNSKFKLLYDCGTNKSAVNSLELDKQQNIWFGGSYGLATITAGDTTGIPWFIPELKDVYIVKLLFQDEHNLWVGTNNGLFRITFQGSSFSRKSYIISQPLKDLSDCFINHLFIDKQSNLWVSTSMHGVFKIKDNRIVENILKQNGLPSEDVMCTFQDNEGIYWFASGSGGVSKLSDFNKFTSPEIEKLLSDAQDILKDPYGRHWVWGGSNLFVVQKGQIAPVDITNTPLFEEGIKKILFSKAGKVWFVNYSGLYSMPLNAQNVDFTQLKLSANFRKQNISYIRLFTEDNDGNIWVGADNGLFVFQGNQLNKCFINHVDSAKIRPYRLLTDRCGYYWMSDFNYGLYRMTLTKLTNGHLGFDYVKAYKSLKPDSAFVTAWIQDLKFDNEGYLWEASLYTGVYKLTINETGVSKVYLYSSHNGLPNNCVSEIVEDKNYNIWFASPAGAILLNKTKNGKETFSSYNSKNGLGDAVYDIFPDDSLVYIHYAEGFYAINPSKEKNDRLAPPNVVITGISIMGKPDTAAMQSQKVYKLKHNHNFIGFDFASISFVHENGILYQYKLDGIDKAWSNYSDRRYVSYNSLPPGYYIFQVRSKSYEGTECRSITQFEFTIMPPYYRTWWFILLCFMALLWGIYLAYNYKVNQLLKIERMRTHIASDLHDDIGSTLSSISILSEILSKQLDHPKSTEMINKIGINARSMLESMDDIIWSVNPANDKFQNLGLRIREYAIPLFEAKNIAFQIQFPDSLATMHLSMDLRRNMYLIAKEAVNNLVKYSQSETARIEFFEHNSLLTLIIQDNGAGFDSTLPSSRNGLRNMHRRAGQINAVLKIESSEGNGTKIQLCVRII